MKTIYSGHGQSLASRNESLPPVQTPKRWNDPALYLADDGLRDAVNVALTVGQPLLLTGEPGTGKTQLAGSIAWETGLPLRVFNVKTTSTAKDLFYRYDSLRHFHAAHNNGQTDVRSFITPEALGLAILQSLDTPAARVWLTAEQQAQGATRSVVLIDELDKAPRDLPNDVLNEFERMSFSIAETGETFASDDDKRPILILTSNSEKNLPNAFLRRCVYYHIPPMEPAQLEKIVRLRVELSAGFTETMLKNAIAYFTDIRSLALKKTPATAEFLAWIEVLQSRQIDLEAQLTKDQADVLRTSFSLLAKTEEDLAKLRARVK